MSLTDIVLLSAVEIFGDFNLRWYAETDKPVYLGAGILGYAGVVYWLVVSLKSYNVLYVNGMWDGISGLIESVAAYVVLGDRFDKPHNYIGLLLVILGIFLMKK